MREGVKGRVAQMDRSPDSESGGRGFESRPDRQPMTTEEMLVIVASLNDHHGRGGQTELARRTGWNHSTVWRKLNGKLKISRADALLILDAVKAKN